MMFVKIVFSITLVVLALVVNTHQQDQETITFRKLFNDSVDACLKQVVIDRESVFKALNTDPIPNDPKLNCYYNCIHLRLGVIDETGDVVDDALQKLAKALYDKETRSEVMQKCKDIKGTDLCLTSYKLMLCIQESQD